MGSFADLLVAFMIRGRSRGILHSHRLHQPTGSSVDWRLPLEALPQCASRGIKGLLTRGSICNARKGRTCLRSLSAERVRNGPSWADLGKWRVADLGLRSFCCRRSRTSCACGCSAGTTAPATTTTTMRPCFPFHATPFGCPTPRSPRCRLRPTPRWRSPSTSCRASLCCAATLAPERIERARHPARTQRKRMEEPPPATSELHPEGSYRFGL